jgi:hypothetical protein
MQFPSALICPRLYYPRLYDTKAGQSVNGVGDTPVAELLPARLALSSCKSGLIARSRLRTPAQLGGAANATAQASQATSQVGEHAQGCSLYQADSVGG